MAGYSGTPLAKKLGIKEQTSVVAVDAPNGYRKLLEPLPAAVRFSTKIDKTVDVVHVFSKLPQSTAAERRRLGVVAEKIRESRYRWPQTRRPQRAAQKGTDLFSAQRGTTPFTEKK